MARPTDPDKLAALRVRQAANSRAYRARKAASAAPAYHTTPPPPKVRQAPSSEAAVRRAHEQRANARERRHKIVGELTSARNPSVKIYTPREPPTAPAGIPDTPGKRRERIKRIRDNAKGQQLVAVGREFKKTLPGLLRNDPRGEAIRDRLTRDQYTRLQGSLARMGKASIQTLGIYLQYEGGSGDFQSTLTRLAYPGDSDVEDHLGQMDAMADNLEKAEGLYGPRAVGRLRI